MVVIINIVNNTIKNVETYKNGVEHTYTLEKEQYRKFQKYIDSIDVEGNYIIYNRDGKIFV